VSHQFQGPAWNLLSNNCNHFTSSLCYRLTDKDIPSWINRAASIGVALPCVVPQAWISVSPPTADDADGDLLEEYEETEATGLLRSQPDAERSDSTETLTGHENDHPIGSRANHQEAVYGLETKSRAKVKPLSHRIAAGHH